MKLKNVNTLTLNDPCYPSALTHIEKPPKQLFFIGSSPEKWTVLPRVAIVGSRKATGYGRAITEELSTRLARAGLVVISGLAFGIDACAHTAAVKAGGLSVAVLPTPVTNVYPASHQQLAERIVESGGCLISEYRDKSEIFKANFLERNRIVSGLADVVIVTEAAIRSGSLATARFALDQGKTVMAVPGDINRPTSAGCNNLVKAGALPLTEPEDVFFALGLKDTGSQAVKFSGSEAEERVLELIRQGLSSQEELAQAAGLDGPSVSAVLTMLEINGVIRALGGGHFTAA